MMKSLFSLILLLAFSANALAYDFMVDGLCYDICSGGDSVIVTYESELLFINYKSNYNNLKGDIVIPKRVKHKDKSYTVVRIGNRAFKGCKDLTSATIPNSVTEIGSDAFSRCTGLTSVKFSDSLRRIGSYAFYGCTGLTSIKFPNSVTEIGSSAFDGCTGLTSVNFPDSLNGISSYAFYGCTSLTTVEIPNSVKGIGNGAFEGCTGLTSATIPNSATEIGSSAFDGCTGLTSVKLPNSVKKIGSSAFSGCNNLVSITVELTNTTFDSRDNCNAIIETATNSLIVGCKNTIIPSSIKTIGSSAFSGCTGLTSIKFPNSVTEIGSYAFYGCTSLTTVETPNSVKGIGTGAFEGCTGLTSATIPNSVTEIGSSAFSRCTGLTSVKLPNSVKKIDSSAFSGCNNLVSIIVELTNTTYDSRDNCNAIIETATNTLIVGCNNTKIPSSIKTIGSSAFSGCTGLTSIKFPNSVTEIGSSAFSRCTGLTSVNFPDSLNGISSYAFYGCTGLTSIKFPNSVIEIGSSAFDGCTGLTTLNLPDSLRRIDRCAFYGCTGLTSIKFPNSVTEIGNSAFSRCTGLTSVYFPDSLRRIDRCAFYGCTGLTAVEIPNSVKGIGTGAFEGCTGLTSATIPNSVTWIGARAFEDCNSLAIIISKIRFPQNISTHITTFNGVNNKTCNLKVPTGTIELYKKELPWCYFKMKEDSSIVTNDTETESTKEQEALTIEQQFMQYYKNNLYDNAIKLGELMLTQPTVADGYSKDLLIGQLANCYYQKGNYRKAIEYIEQYRFIIETIKKKDSFEIAMVDDCLGALYMEITDYARAGEYYLRAFHSYMSCDTSSIYQQRKNTKSFDVTFLNIFINVVINERIGRCYLLQQQYDQAHNYLSHSEAIIHQLTGHNRMSYLLSLFKPGLSLRSLLNEMPIFNIFYNHISLNYFFNLFNTVKLTPILIKENLLKKLKPYTNELYTYTNELVTPLSPLLEIKTNLEFDYCIYYASQGDFAKSYNYLRKSLEVIYDNSIRFLVNNTSAERSAYWEKNSNLFCEIYPYVVVMADKHKSRNDKDLNYSDLYGDLYNKSALFSKGLLLTSDSEFSRIIYESGDSILISRYDELEDMRNVQGPLTEEQSYNIAIRATELEKKLMYISNYKEFINILKLTWKDVQARLRPDDIAIEFLSFPKLGSDSTFYIALTVRKDYDRPHMLFLGEEHELQAAAQNAYTSNELCQLIWGKLSNELDSIKVQNIYFSPSGIFHQIAIESMPHWVNTDLLMNQCYSIYRLSSTRELVIERDSIQSHTAAVYGDIEYNTPVVAMGTPRKVTDQSSSNGKRGFDADSAGYRGKEWDNLRYSKPEINSITSILESKKIDVYKMTQKDATETSFKDLSKQKKNIIHISTHGFCWNDSAARAEEKNRRKSLSFLGNGMDAMTRSGLLFSGANNCFAYSVVIPDTIDDGVLTAYEVSTLDLRDLDLLVLSACETGLGDISAEGVFGLQRGFKKAGARSIIMSLWKVDDLATSDMMTQFYKYWIEFGMSKQKAFFKAQQDLKDKDNDYIYDEDKETDKKMRATKPHWAAFILLDALDN